MGSRKDAALEQSVASNMSMAEQMYNISFGAQKGMMDYQTKSYGMGGFDQGAKFQAKQAGVLDAFGKRGPGNFLRPEELGGTMGMRAEALSNVSTEKVMAGMDELNRIRATLAGNGLQTTNFAQQEGSIGVKAASMMDQNPTMSTVNAGLGLASTVYGAYKNQSKPSQPPPQFGFGMQGSSMSNWATTPITSLMPPGQLGFTGGR